MPMPLASTMEIYSDGPITMTWMVSLTPAGWRLLIAMLKREHCWVFFNHVEQ